MKHSTHNLLVTGGAGFIGSNFVHYWARTYPGERIIVLDALTYAGNQTNLQTLIANQQITFIHGDILDTYLIEDLLNSYQIDTLVRFAS